MPEDGQVCGLRYCMMHGTAHSEEVSCEEYEAAMAGQGKELRRTLEAEGDRMEGFVDSLLVKVLGIYKVRLHSMQYHVFFMVMEKLGKGLQPELEFDLKGSNNKGAHWADKRKGRDRDLRQVCWMCCV